MYVIIYTLYVYIDTYTYVAWLSGFKGRSVSVIYVCICVCLYGNMCSYMRVCFCIF